MDKNPLFFDICMMYGYFVKSLPGRCSDFLLFFLIYYYYYSKIHSVTICYLECLNFSSQENYDIFSF